MRAEKAAIARALLWTKRSSRSTGFEKTEATSESSVLGSAVGSREVTAAKNEGSSPSNGQDHDGRACQHSHSYQNLLLGLLHCPTDARNLQGRKKVPRECQFGKEMGLVSGEGILKRLETHSDEESVRESAQNRQKKATNDSRVQNLQDGQEVQIIQLCDLVH